MKQIEVNKASLRKAEVLLRDSLFKCKFNKDSIDDLKAIKLLHAREENIDFEARLAEMICGDNKAFPYRSSYYLTKFFQELGFQYSHDGSTRRFWVKDVLEELPIQDIALIIEKGLFRKGDFRKPEFACGRQPEELYANAVTVFKQFIEESVTINEHIDLSYLLDININAALLFDSDIQTKDDDLNALLFEAKRRFSTTDDKQIALEKLWDAFERIKTYFDADKKQSADRLLSVISGDIDKQHFEAEFKKFTEIGNRYRIRHHEVDKLEINDDLHRSYLFYSLLNLLILCIYRLNQNETDLV